jgi:5'(3')-deoxyribonucleotidase
MKELTFAIDVDEVIRDNIENMLKVYNKEYNDNKTLEDLFDFQVDKVFTKIQETTGETASKYFFEKHAKEVFTDSVAIDGAKEAIDILRGYGKVIIVTYQKNLENRVRTLEWLDKNDIKYDGICFLRDKSLVYTDFLVDDNDWNFIGCNCTHGILIDRPYNKNTDIEELEKQSNCKSISRFKSLKDFADYFRKKMKLAESLNNL